VISCDVPASALLSSSDGVVLGVFLDSPMLMPGLYGNFSAALDVE
jgi:hypothetical protein